MTKYSWQGMYWAFMGVLISGLGLFFFPLWMTWVAMSCTALGTCINYRHELKRRAIVRKELTNA